MRIYVKLEQSVHLTSRRFVFPVSRQLLASPVSALIRSISEFFKISADNQQLSLELLITGDSLEDDSFTLCNEHLVKDVLRDADLVRLECTQQVISVIPIVQKSSNTETSMETSHLKADLSDDDSDSSDSSDCSSTTSSDSASSDSSSSDDSSDTSSDSDDEPPDIMSISKQKEPVEHAAEQVMEQLPKIPKIPKYRQNYSKNVDQFTTITITGITKDQIFEEDFTVSMLNLPVNADNATNTTGSVFQWDQVCQSNGVTSNNHSNISTDLIERFTNLPPNLSLASSGKRKRFLNGKRSKPAHTVFNEPTTTSAEKILPVNEWPEYSGAPVVGNTIAFKVLEMDMRTFTPILSSHKVARIDSYSEDSGKLTVTYLDILEDQSNENLEVDWDDSVPGDQSTKRKMPRDVLLDSFQNTDATENSELEWPQMQDVRKKPA